MPRIALILFWFLILCIGGAGLYDELQCGTKYDSNVVVHGGNPQHAPQHNQHAQHAQHTHHTPQHNQHLTNHRPKNLTKDKILVLINPSDQDPEFVEKVTDILNHTKFTPGNKLLEISITSNKNDKPDVTLELGDRDTMHKNNKVEKDANGEIIYFSYTYNTTPRKIIFDPGNWLFGVKRSGLALNDYRDYVVRHEMMHALGYDHQECNEQTSTLIDGKMVCPVMYQSTRGPPPGFTCGSQIAPVDYTSLLPW